MLNVAIKPTLLRVVILSVVESALASYRSAKIDHSKQLSNVYCKIILYKTSQLSLVYRKRYSIRYSFNDIIPLLSDKWLNVIGNVTQLKGNKLAAVLRHS